MGSGRKFGSRKYRTVVLIEKQNGLYVVFVNMSTYEVQISYLLTDLKGVVSYDKKVVLKFQHPEHEMLVMTGDIDTAKKFKEDLISLAKSLNLHIEELFPHSILSHFGSIVGCHTLQNMDVSTLRIIALENCYLPNLPEGLGNLTISSLSLNGSKLNIPTCGINTVWNWMTKRKISTSLNVLEMNSMGLERLPFEIIYLKRIQALSVSNNKLVSSIYRQLVF
ncbi:leucine-rich repeat and death domain-containing protein 1-like [Aphis craccivora]|uniref:Leucine-rich repeat and death domain-containing protein 1-like n=1 Tax=Aphis craccivora TaxID=307492 RepID=A0A6G0ZBC5_APHCR|nr:leucine-rich repeat and death domain-containing protein 1-like [Aphis craccivora]